MRRLAVLLTIGATGGILAACGGTDHSGMDSSSGSSNASASTSAAPAAGATFNDADVTFAQGMIPHHRQAVEMAKIALEPERGASPAVVDLATRIQAAQDPEIELMSGWLAEWGQPEAMNTDGGEMGSMEGMEGMMSDEEMAALEEANGAELDQMWLEMMISHHEGAVSMAETEQSEGSDPEAVELAGQIVEAQRAEIEEMNTLLAG